MHSLRRFLLFASAGLLVAGCASATDQRISSLEGRMGNMQVLDMRLSTAEERLGKVESDVAGLRGELAAGKPGAGKKGDGRSRKAPKGAALVPASAAASESRPPSLLPPAPGTPPDGEPHSAGSDSPAPKTGTGEYDSALARYYNGQYAKAQEDFAAFLSRHPSSPLTPNALYWQGECLYAQKKFDAAIMLFKDIAAKYPGHPKAAAALLKAGFAYARINDMENARFYWQILVDDFPRSEPAGIARKRLAQG
jgi:tol-pal system protein YbgF